MVARKLPPNSILVELHNNGLSANEIGRRYGATGAAVLQKLKKEGIVTGNFWKGKKVPRELVERRISKIRGENHYLWKGGLERRPYRQMVEKEVCIRCGSIEELLIHHKDGDHYNNAMDNLEVVCNRCHSSQHKKEYWQQVRNGEKPPPKYGPYGHKARKNVRREDSQSSER